MHKHIQFSLSFVFVCSFVLSTYAQEKAIAKDSIRLPLEIKGTLLESNGTPIPYATVQYGNQQGVISNDEGRFRFLFDRLPIESDSLLITCMGFERTAIPLDGYRDSTITLASKNGLPWA